MFVVEWFDDDSGEWVLEAIPNSHNGGPAYVFSTEEEANQYLKDTSDGYPTRVVPLVTYKGNK